MKAILTRFDDDGRETLGQLIIEDDKCKPVFKCNTLELPWRNNEHRISCIPPGDYQVQKRVNDHHGNHFHVLDVPNRTFILIHSGNYKRDTLGCILPGSGLADINHDGYRDVINSRQTMEKLWDLLPQHFQLIILEP